MVYLPRDKSNIVKKAPSWAAPTHTCMASHNEDSPSPLRVCLTLLLSKIQTKSERN